MAPTLFTSCKALPREGVVFLLSGPAKKFAFLKE